MFPLWDKALENHRVIETMFQLTYPIRSQISNFTIINLPAEVK